MLSKTLGIVVRSIKYGESSAITNIYTEQYGLLGFHVPAAYKGKGKVKISHLQPLNAVELSFNYRKTSHLQRISDISCKFYAEPTTLGQRALYSACCELVQQIIRENEQNPSLFHYLYQHALPGLNNNIHFWQLPFMMLNVLHHYGCAPNTDSFDEGALLDLQNGIFVNRLVPLKYLSDEGCSRVIYEILTQGIAHLPKNLELRHQVIEDLISYYRLHINDNFDLRSREVLNQLRVDS